MRYRHRGASRLPRSPRRVLSMKAADVKQVGLPSPLPVMIWRDERWNLESAPWLLGVLGEGVDFDCDGLG